LKDYPRSKSSGCQRGSNALENTLASLCREGSCLLEAVSRPSTAGTRADPRLTRVRRLSMASLKNPCLHRTITSEATSPGSADRLRVMKLNTSRAVVQICRATEVLFSHATQQLSNADNNSPSGWQHRRSMSSVASHARDGAADSHNRSMSWRCKIAS
jgi:hypothetical protein